MFKLLNEFARRYLNDSYQVTLYINMVRIQKAEMELNELTCECQKVIKEISMLMMHNVAITVYAGTMWLKKARRTIDYNKRRRAKMLETQ